MNQFCSSCFSFFDFIFVRFIVSCCAAANSPPSFVYPMADKRNCRNVILKYVIWLPTHESLKPAMKDALKNILGFLCRCFLFFFASRQDLMPPPRLIKTEYLDETDRYSPKMTFKNPQSFPTAVTVAAIKVDEGESKSKLAPFHSPGFS